MGRITPFGIIYPQFGKYLLRGRTGCDKLVGQITPIGVIYPQFGKHFFRVVFFVLRPTGAGAVRAGDAVSRRPGRRRRRRRFLRLVLRPQVRHVAADQRPRHR